jgi:hypothetical protein
MKQHFELVYRESFKSNSLLALQQFCTDFMIKSPEKIFKSLDFTLLSEMSLIQLIKRGDLRMKEIEVWEHILKWGLAQNAKFPPDPNTWSDDDFKKMKNTLQHCLPFVKFFRLSSKDFLQKVRPYKELLESQVYEDLLNSHLKSNSKPTVESNSKPTIDFIFSKNLKIDGIVNSCFINNLSIIPMISGRIDVSNDFTHSNESYKFQLLLRGSRDGFTPKIFHTLCDGKPHTVTFIKIKGTEEIIGGYNPLKWESSGGWGKTKHSFIFSFYNNNAKDAIISNIKHAECALNYGTHRGPCFGQDIVIHSRNGNPNRDYYFNYCKKCYYEISIRGTENPFSIEDYEVFQIIMR